MTTMGGGFTLDDDRVQAHAIEVEEIAQRVHRIAGAGRHTQQLSDGAFGLIGEAFAVTARQGMAQGVRDVASLAGSADLVARGLAAAATSYRQAESRNCGMFGGGRA